MGFLSEIIKQQPLNELRKPFNRLQNYWLPVGFNGVDYQKSNCKNCGANEYKDNKCKYCGTKH
jgi:hypothetical protein